MGRPRTLPKTSAKKTMQEAYSREYRVAQNIEMLMVRNRVSRTEVMTYMDWSDTTLWRRLKKYPGEISLTELYALCDLFGVTLDTLQRDPFAEEGAAYAQSKIT